MLVATKNSVFAAGWPRPPCWLDMAKTCAASDHPVSVIIPTIHAATHDRPALPGLIASLLHSKALRNPATEIVINHGTPASFAYRQSLRAQIRTKRWAPTQNLSQLVHFYGPRAELFAASRFFAAAAARHDIIVTIDDDVLPYHSQIHPVLHGLVCAIATEPGFPLYAAAHTPGLHGHQERFCDRRGYEQPPRDAKYRVQKQWRNRHSIILTNFASFSRVLATRLTARLDAWYADWWAWSLYAMP